MVNPNADLCFEVSWEVCNKVGGIFTVLKSKAAQMLKKYKNNYFTIGPFFHEKNAGQFLEELPDKNLKKIFDELAQEGIKCHYGKWLVKGEPQCILIDFQGYKNHINEMKKQFWEVYQIDSLGTEYYDYEEPMIWSYAVGRLIEKISQSQNKKIVTHCHEWLAAGCLLYLKMNKAKVATVFTTHATMLGRTIASFSNIDLYKDLKNIDPKKTAYDLKVQTKYLTEVAAANNADAFTTVSGITGIEAEHLLGRKPDVLLYNGLDFGKFPTFEELSIKHKFFKNKIKEFLMYYFLPYNEVDFDKTLIYFLAGRYEFKDKGIDLYIKALAKLNNKLKKEKSDRNIVAFLWVPGNIRGIKPDLLSNKVHFQDIYDLYQESKDDVEKKLLFNLVTNKKINSKNLMGKHFLSELKTKLLVFNKEGTAPLLTHDLINEEKDEILNALKAHGLTNKKEDKVRVIFYPIYLTGADSLLNTSYYESMIGSHLGVFPSYYEPWGYTPLEAGALGVSSVTTDLAGFGRYVKNLSKKKYQGIYIIDRLDKKDDVVLNSLYKVMYDFSKFTKHERVENKMAARELAEASDWKDFISHYFEAHNLAIEKAYKNKK